MTSSASKRLHSAHRTGGITQEVTLSLVSIPIFHSHLVSEISIPIVGGITGWIINWTGVWMLYNPLHFTGVHIPGLYSVVRLLPQKIRDVPGLRHGGIGWQGIIPSRASKLGSIAVEKQIHLIGSPGDFYARMEPDKIADQIVEQADAEVPQLVDRILAREHPELWYELTPRAREAIHARVRAQLPEIVHHVTDQIGEHIDEVLDVKQMVIRITDEHPELTNRLFHETGAKEFRFIIRFGFVFGFLCGLPMIPLVDAIASWWVFPLAQAVSGLVTNWLAIWLIYKPLEPRKIGPIKFQGLFLRRQHEAAAAYAEVIADKIITLGNIGEELLQGPRSDRTRRMIEGAMRPAVEQAAGVAGTVLRIAQPERFKAVREAIALEAPDYTLGPMRNPELNRDRNGAIRELFTKRMREMKPATFSETLRSATSEDEWMLVAHGALFGIISGLLHYTIFGV